MNKRECLDRLFQTFVTGGTPPQEEIRQLADAIETDDIPWLLHKIEALRDPSQNFTGNDQGDEKAVFGFFLYIDLVSALLIKLGESGATAIDPFRGSKAPYMAWVLKYVDDPRFHAELLGKFQLEST